MRDRRTLKDFAQLLKCKLFQSHFAALCLLNISQSDIPTHLKKTSLKVEKNIDCAHLKKTSLKVEKNIDCAGI